ncbi:MAG: hypothetical protein MK132_24865 [Lentisphaerales bacterium]|nr:hypothetical protein [Lentisphaerales bacterium]
MYDLYFADEQSMPCMRLKRFRNFNKKNQNIPFGGGGHTFHDTGAINAQVLAAVQLPEELNDELARHDITETARLFLRSPHSSLNSKGEAYVIAFDELLVLMWKPDSATIYNLVKLESNEIEDLIGEIEEQNDELIVLHIMGEEKSYSMWFPESHENDVVEFINSWKVFIAHVDEEAAPKDHEETTEMEYLDEEGEVHVVPDISEVEQKDLPRTVLFGTLLIDQMADKDNNITSVDLEYLSMVISNTDLLSMCITNFKKHVTGKILNIVKDEFSDDQKLMLVSNMADLAYRDGEPHEHELLKIHDLVKAVDFPTETLEQMLKIFKAKNDPEILENY